MIICITASRLECPISWMNQHSYLRKKCDSTPVNLFEQEFVALRVTMDVAFMIVKDEAFAKLKKDASLKLKLRNFHLRLELKKETQNLQ